MEKIKNKKDVIVINRMYVGDYLNSNLGHEVINMFTADDGKHYLYLNAYGSFASQWQIIKKCWSILKSTRQQKTNYPYRDLFTFVGKQLLIAKIFLLFTEFFTTFCYI